MQKIRWGILSTAHIGLTQVIPAIQRSEFAEVVAIASESGKETKAAEEHGIPKTYNSYQRLLDDPEIDAVYIPLPNHLHKKWAIAAAKAGKHVLCEKPAAITFSDAIEMVEACRENNVQFMEGFMYQFHPQHSFVKELIASGEIGTVKLVRSSFSFFLNDRENNIRMKKEMGGGSLFDVGCYCIHAIRNIVGSEPVSVDVKAHLDSESGVDLSAFGYLDFSNGVQATFDCSFDMTFRQGYEVIGTTGKITVPRAFRPDVNGSEGLIIIENEKGLRMEKILGDIYLSQVDHFCQSIKDNKEPFYSGDMTIQNMRVLSACYDSINTGSKISLD